MWTGEQDETSENSNQLAICMYRDTQTNQWFVERVEFNLPGSRTRTTFNVPQPLRQAFSDEFVAELTPLLPSSHDRGLLADGQINIALSHLSLIGVRVAAQAAFNGIQKVWVRFQRAFGAVQDLLQPQHCTERATVNGLHYVAASTLLDLVLPCLDILRLDGLDPEDREATGRVAARLTALQDKKHDLEFYAGLLTRFLAAPEPEKVPPRVAPSEDAHSALQGFRLPGPITVR